jgi:hypothetical protein
MGKSITFTNLIEVFKGGKKNEADAMEAETLLAMKSFIIAKVKASPINMPTDFFNEKGRKIQEWDGILLSEDTLYLLEAKHSMTDETLKKIAERVEKFPKMIEQSLQKEFDVTKRKVVGVACGIQFPESCRQLAHRVGLMVVYPSGSRYKVDDETNFNYVLER